jgi:LCP family protein required for cell wall assembly
MSRKPRRRRADASSSRRSLAWPAELAAPAGEEVDRFALPLRGEHDWEEGSVLPSRRSRKDARDRGGPVPLGKPGISASKEVRRRPRRMVLKALLAIFLLGVCSTTSFAAAKFYEVYAIAQSVTGKALPNIGTTKGNVQPGALPDTLSSIKAFNMLLLGSDNDAKFSAGSVLTQTDIVVRVDLANHKVTMVSIPRDMWLTSDEGTCCYKLDEISGAETTGPSTPLLNGLAHTVATVENDFGIPISAYAWVGLQGFVNVINTLGGVDVDVLHPIVDDAYPKDLDPNGDPYAYQRLYIPAGPQHLDGEQALDYVRSRHSDLQGDFGRSARQQSVLVALKKKLDSGTIISHLDALANDLKNSVITSLTIPQVLSLANFARGLSPTDFIQKVLSVPTYGYSDVVNGKDVIQPDWGAITTTIKQIFSDSAPPVVNLHNITANDKQTVAGEGAAILVENGTTTAGVAAQLATDLKGEGFNVVQATNADSDTYQTTQIEGFKPASGGATQFDGTCQVLSKLLGVMYQVSPQAPPAGVDVVIIVGADTAAQIQQQS